MHVVSNGRIIGLMNSALAGILEWMWPNLRFKTGFFSETTVVSHKTLSQNGTPQRRGLNPGPPDKS
jgi:hypothetical protein